MEDKFENTTEAMETAVEEMEVDNPFPNDAEELEESDELEEVEDDGFDEEDDEDDDPTEEDISSKETTEETAGSEEMFPMEVDIFGNPQKFTMQQAVRALQDTALMPIMAQDLKAAQNNPAILFVNEMAKSLEITPAEYIARTQNSIKYKDLAEEYGGVENIPSKVMEVFAENAEINKNKAEQAFEEMRQSQIRSSMQEFSIKHPEVEVLPDEVLHMCMEGKHIEDAYNAYQVKKLTEENKGLKEQLKIQKTNATNRARMTPKATSNARAKVSANPWEAGFGI